MSLITSDQRRVIVGLGQSGLSVARYFCREGLSFSVIDTRDNPPGLEQLKALKSDVECISADLSVELLQDATQLIVSPGISVQTEVFKQLHAKGIEIIGDIELFCRHVSQPIIAITGSNAKSTVTSLVGEMAKNSGIKCFSRIYILNRKISS